MKMKFGKREIGSRKQAEGDRREEDFWKKRKDEIVEI